MTTRTDDLVRLLEHAVEQPPEHGVGYVQDDGSVRCEPYPALLQRAACVLGGLRQRNLRPGEHVVLALTRNESFLAAFCGCVLGGVVPAPVAAPAGAANGGVASERLLNVRKALGGPVVLVENDSPAAEAVCSRWWPVADVLADRPDRAFHRPHPSDTALGAVAVKAPCQSRSGLSQCSSSSASRFDRSTRRSG